MPGTVTVACKVPCGFAMQLYRMEDAQEPVMGGGWKAIKRAVPTGKLVVLHGPAKAIGKDVPWEIKSGVGLTHGVDADFFAKWMEDNKEADVVTGGHIFANVKTGEVLAEAKDRISLKTGLEPIDRNNLPAEFRPTIKTADGS